MPPLDALVTNAHLRQSLVAVRSLGRSGCTVGAMDTVSSVPAFWSRWCHESHVCPADEGAPEYLRHIEDLLEHPGARVVIASHDGSIAQMRRHRRRLERHTRLALASESALTVAVNKAQTLAVARHLGVRVPPMVTLSAVAQTQDAIREVGLPAVVKPTESWLGADSNGTWLGPELVTTPEEAQSAVALIVALGGVALFQTLLTGRREAVSLLVAGGQVKARFAQWAKRTRPPLGGESVLRQSIPVPADSGRAAERLVLEIGLEGYAEVEFRRDSRGEAHLMEINPRLSASVELAVRTGVDFPRLLWQWASGAAIDRALTYRTGRWMRFLQGDVLTTIAAFGQRGRPGIAPPMRAAVAFGLSFLRPAAYDYVDWRDPLPAVKAAAEFTSDFTRSCARAAMRRGAAGFRKPPSSIYR